VYCMNIVVSQTAFLFFEENFTFQALRLQDQNRSMAPISVVQDHHYATAKCIQRGVLVFILVFIVIAVLVCSPRDYHASRVAVSQHRVEAS
jgi:hypothetical protein